ncbi:hypothetical protein FQN53_005383 [Emmonsiellopsis sp. PD_33]|nr:hypothetical protein FQN53_005383 [Emmonsiellopsis sp. PD_33]
MHPRTTLNLSLLLLLALNIQPILTNPLPALSPRQTPCAPLTILSARGSSESPGEGRLAAIADILTSTHANSVRRALDYPAKIFPYFPSLVDGINALVNLLNSTLTTCPDSKFVLMGYSQGAHVIGDVLCGGTLTWPVGEGVGEKVAAIIFMADPRHVVGEPYNVGTSTHHGLFPRLSGQCEKYASRMRSYCDAGDPVCDSGFDREVHRRVVEKYKNDAVGFVNGLL